MPAFCKATINGIKTMGEAHTDELVWQEIPRLLQDPTLIQSEIERRTQEAKKADPLAATRNTTSVANNYALINPQNLKRPLA
jgi:hypothetical protein